MIKAGGDFNDIQNLILHEKVWDWVSDDGAIKDDFEISDNDVYLSVIHDDVTCAYFMLSPINSICWEIHTLVKPEYWGKSLDYTKEVVLWIFDNTTCLKIITFVPETNHKAIKLAEKTGMKREGFINKSWLKNGELFGQYILGISKGDLCQ